MTPAEALIKKAKSGSKLTLEESAELYNVLQNRGHIHPLTCNNSQCRCAPSEGIFEAKVENGKIIIFCPECKEIDSISPHGMLMSSLEFADIGFFRIVEDN